MGIRANGIHHLAISTADIKAQIEFCAHVLGAELVGLFEMHGVPGGLHSFSRLGDDCFISFVQLPENAAIEAELGVTHAGTGAGTSAPGTQQHLAFRVDSVNELLDMRDRIRSRGVNVIGQIDHGLCQSIYFAGPEGLTLEVACPAADLDADVWIDPAIVARAGITAEELGGYRNPAGFEGSGGSVPQPPMDPAKPHMAYPEDEYAKLLATPDEIITKYASYAEPPGAADRAGELMRQPGTPEGCEHVAYVVGFREPAAFSDTYGGGGDVVGLDCHLVRPQGSASDAASAPLLVFMHPTGGGMYLPIISGLATAGHHVLWANSRYRGTDSALIMEKVAADLGAAICDARDRLGYRRIVLAGWSGGGSLSMWYQSLAEAGQGIEATPAGDPYEVAPDRLPPADAVLMLAAHISRHGTLTEWLDPSITDETRPFERDARLNLYDPDNRAQPPYTDEYLAEYREAQLARNRRITAWVLNTLAELRAGGDANKERAFTVHGTMADPRWLDPAIDPSDRRPGWCYLGDPELVNDGPVGLARFSTLRSWLSQWSYDHARADALVAARSTSVPVLVVGNTADDACTPSHTHRIFAAVPHDRKLLHEVQGATHYYGGAEGRRHLAEAVGVIGSFVTANLPG